MDKVKKGPNYSPSPGKIKGILQKAKGSYGGENFNTYSDQIINKDTSMISLHPFGSAHTLKGPGGSKHALSSRRPTVPSTADDSSSSFLPDIAERYSGPRTVFTGKAIDEFYTKNNTDLLKLLEENKNIKTEANQMKKINEKLVDRCDFLNSIIEKEASATTYMYNYPPKADESVVKKDAGKKDNEGQKLKKMYEDMTET